MTCVGPNLALLGLCILKWWAEAIIHNSTVQSVLTIVIVNLRFI